MAGNIDKSTKWGQSKGGGGKPSFGGILKRLVRLFSAGMITVVILALLLIGALVGALFFWFGCRIEVGAGQYVVLTRKTGKDLTNEMVIAPDGEHKGLQKQVLKEGRYFYNPYTWQWSKPLTAVVIESGQVGVKIRQYGEPLPPGGVLAKKDEQKGIVPEPLRPGRYYVNKHAVEVQIMDMVKIDPGYMGVVTRNVGREPENVFGFVVAEGERGVQPFVLKPGTHPKYSNHYAFRVDALDVRSHKLEMSGGNTIKFPSKYGFDIIVDGTIEWAPDIKELPRLFAKYVDEADLEESGGINNIENKIILPFARSFFRTVGGSYRAVDFITGDTRARVQASVEEQLRDACAAEGLLIRSVVIKATKPPQKIREQYERRELASRMLDRYEKEIERELGDVVIIGREPALDSDGEPITDASGEAIMGGGDIKLGADDRPETPGGRLNRELARRKKDRAAKLGEVRERNAVDIRAAEQYANVELTKARRKLEVAGIRLKAARDRAEAVVAQGEAEAAVTVMRYKAEAAGVKEKVKAFGTGEKYAEHALIRKLAPGIDEILSNTDGLFARLFERFVQLEAAEPADDNAQPGGE